MNLIKKYTKVNLVLRIFCGLIIGALFGIVCHIVKNSTYDILIESNIIIVVDFTNTMFNILGNLFIGALRGIAPILVFFLVSTALMKAQKSGSTTIKRQLLTYLVATFLAAFMAVVINYLFPVKLTLPGETDLSSYNAASDLTTIMINMFKQIVENPVSAIANANFLGVLMWAIFFGVVGKKFATESFKNIMETISIIITNIVSYIIQFAPIGVMSLVFMSVMENGLNIFTDYGILLVLYLACTFAMFFIVNPLIVFTILKRNPYPLVWKTIIECGITAFFLRSSAANIPVNMKFCDKLHLDRSNYSVSIPLGSTINMEGAAITIITLTLACCHTLGINIEIGPAILLSILATISAAGSSGVSGGSILLIPLVCGMFGISGDIASSVVAVGFIIGVIQDSVETALNSSTDALFTATIQFYEKIKAGKPVHKIIGGELDDKAETIISLED